MKYLVAVSGGVDSVVLLDRLVNEKQHELVVAHFDHGIREDSADDARFVEALAAKYHLPFVMKREELGKSASEETARRQRYGFLESAAQTAGASIVTAHHADDVIETIAINLSRGTGWRGAAVLDTPKIIRPLLGIYKTDFINEAVDKRLEWVEDSTNAGDGYLRNRVRHQVARELPLSKKEMLRQLWLAQIQLKAEITKELAKFVTEDNTYKRYLFIQAPLSVTTEILRAVIVIRTNLSPTRPQLERAILAIKTAKSGSSYELGGRVLLQFTTDSFIVQTP